MAEIDASEKRQGLHLACFSHSDVESKRNSLARPPKMRLKCESQVSLWSNRPSGPAGRACFLMACGYRTETRALNLWTCNWSANKLWRKTHEFLKCDDDPTCTARFWVWRASGDVHAVRLAWVVECGGVATCTLRCVKSRYIPRSR